MIDENYVNSLSKEQLQQELKYSLEVQYGLLHALRDTPEMPSRFHQLIVYRAVLKYVFDRAAPEALQRASLEGTQLQGALELNQLPRMRMGRPLI